jgi:cell division protein FtsB
MPDDEKPLSRKVNWVFEHDIRGASKPVYITLAYLNGYWGKERAKECSATVHDGKMYTYVHLHAKAYESEILRLAEHIESNAMLQAMNVKYYSFQGKAYTHAIAAEHVGMQILMSHYKEKNPAFRMESMRENGEMGKFFKMVETVSTKNQKRARESMDEQNKKLKAETTALRAEIAALKVKVHVLSSESEWSKKVKDVETERDEWKKKYADLEACLKD